MSFIRPKARARLAQWRGVIQAGILLFIGFWLGTQSYGILSWVGWAAFILALFLLRLGWVRARISPREGGRGVVEVSERELSFLTGEGGVRFSLNEVVRIDIETNDRGPFEDDMIWMFTTRDGARHEVSGGASNGETIFDTLAAFSGVNFENVIKASASTDNALFPIWQKHD